jgi:hypothetical protein
MRLLGTSVTTYAGTASTSGHIDGVATLARFNIPNGLAIDSNQNLYVGDVYNRAIRLITSSGTHHGN